jgi:hypothetical protein
MGNTLKFLMEYKDYLSDIDNSNNDNYIYNEILKQSKYGRLSIVEGLIHSFPVDKSINILKKRFPELEIQLEEDGELFIENQPPHKLNKYLPLITNIGYFISKLTINGKDWIKDFDSEIKPIAFIIEPKYDYEVVIPKKLYHASPIKFKDKILKKGLSPKSGNKIANHPNRVYLTDDMEKAINFGRFLQDEKNKWYDDGYCIYSIDGDAIDKLYSDINYRSGGFYTNNNINPNFIKLIKTYN